MILETIGAILILLGLLIFIIGITIGLYDMFTSGDYVEFTFFLAILMLLIGSILLGVFSK